MFDQNRDVNFGCDDSMVIFQNDSVVSEDHINSSFEFKNDPARIPNSVPVALQSYFIELGPCQPTSHNLPNKEFPKTYDSHGKFRSFHESYYFKQIENQPPCKRWWLSYSLSENKIFCISCKLFGLPKTKKQNIVSSGSCDWKNILRVISNHENCPDHLESEINRNLFTKRLKLDFKKEILHSANRKVAENREVVRTIVDALVFIARQNIALRGHNEKHTSLNKGNFLELISLLGNYHPTLKHHLNTIKINDRNRLTFLSNKSQNVLLDIMKEQIRSKILYEIKHSQMFSVIIDTTTDISNLEQFTLIARYVDKGFIQERLVALVTASDGTGKGLFQEFCNITDKYNLNWQSYLYAQSYDGAASMQGQYSGLKTLIQQQNHKAIYIWCFAHLLNLVVVDTADSSIHTRQFLGDLQTLIAFMRARKRTAEFVDCQKKLQPTERIQKIKSFSNTRWTSHGRVINVVYSKFKALTTCLYNLSKSDDRTTASGANIHLKIITTFNFVLTMILLKKIFAITTPLSNYLQSKSLDFIEALRLVDISEKQLISLRCDSEFEKTVNEAKYFAKEHQLTELYFKDSRQRVKKKMAGEENTDEVISSPFIKYRCETYFKVLDKVNTSIQSRFSGARDILKDLTLLSPERLEYYSNNNKPLPRDSFSKLTSWVPSINLDQIKNEYTVFSKSYKELISGDDIPLMLHKISPSESNSESESYTSDEETEQNKLVKKEIGIDQILHILSTYDLQ
ncbi:zinc finger MYM-type protein 1-like, partial [Aphis craccivora]